VELPVLEGAGIRLVGFFDLGQAYDDAEEIDLAELRYSAGFGVRWWSPMGPLRFEWGFPIDKRADEEPVVFEFTIGNSF
jgi:outer membrane protein insertion porin family